MTIASVVIPAHNEEQVIGRCLAALLTGAEPGELDVIVVANACDDRTAEVARAAGARVIETPVPGKGNALALGDEACLAFPRVYLDADVDLSAESVRLLVATLADQAVAACAPVPEFDLTGVSTVAARFQRVHERLMAPRRGLAGVGVYALGPAGHDRVFPLPDVLADDGWVHRSFAEHERRSVADARCVVRPARTVAAVVRRRARVRLANRQLDGVGAAPADGSLSPRELVGLVRSGRVSVVDAGCFAFVLLCDRVLAKWRGLRGGNDMAWSTDLTSRGQ